MKIDYTPDALKKLKRLDKPIQKRIKSYLDEIASLENPQSRGKALVGNLVGLWRYRVGNYRILCKIKDDHLIITVVEVGHRKDVYEA